MKALYRLLALIVFFTCSTVVLADNSELSYDNLTPNDGIKALELGDALGYKVIPRAELEEIRGENWAYAGKLVYYYGGFSLIREAAGDLKWIRSKLLVNPNGIPVMSTTAHSTAMYYK